MRALRFEENRVLWLVRRGANGTPEYRDAAHLGGPWVSAAKTIANKSIRLSFRRALERAVEGVKYHADERRHALIIESYHDIHTLQKLPCIDHRKLHCPLFTELIDQCIQQVNIDY